MASLPPPCPAPVKKTLRYGFQGSWIPKKSRRGTAAWKVKQGGVKQSGQEPLDVQNWTPSMMDPMS
jgi:hypothetical protein